MREPTHRRQFLRRALGAGGLLGIGVGGMGYAEGPGGPAPLPRGLRRAYRTSSALGTKVTMTALHASETVALRAIDAAFAEIDRIESVMSLYRPDSQLCRLNREGVLDRPHPDLVEVLRQAAAISGRTGGAFDVTVQPLWELYDAARRDGRLPDAEAIDRARRRVDWRRVEVDPRRVRLQGAGTAVTLNGIAQGFAADRAAAVLRDRGVEHALVDAGEVRPLGSRADASPWTVGIQHPRREDAYAWLAPLDGRALSTSGDYATTFSDDRRQHHIVDPHTGRSPAEFASVTVAAPTAMLADALSTALFVSGLEPAVALIEATPKVDALFILKGGRTLATARFPKDA